MACFTRNGDDESFGRGSGRVSSLDISTQSGERFPRRIPRANLSETGPKKRDIYREDLKYKVARGGDGERETLSLLPPLLVPIFRIPIVRYPPRGSCLEIQRFENSIELPTRFILGHSKFFSKRYVWKRFDFSRFFYRGRSIEENIRKQRSCFGGFEFTLDIALYRGETNVTTFHSFLSPSTPRYLAPLSNKHSFYRAHTRTPPPSRFLFSIHEPSPSEYPPLSRSFLHEPRDPPPRGEGEFKAPGNAVSANRGNGEAMSKSKVQTNRT